MGGINIKTLVVLATVGVVGLAGFLALHQMSSAASGDQIYTSASGGFSFTYPAGWTAKEASVGAYSEILIMPPNAVTSASNQFLMTLLIAPNPDVARPPTTIASGTMVKLSNGINLWTSTTASALRKAAETTSTTCPEIGITDKNQAHLSYPLSNGLNLAVIAGYCEGQASTTSLTYEQQLAQGDWQTAVSIIKSIKFN